MLSLAACNEGIDPITPVAPGTDTIAPVVKMSYPAEGTAIQVKEDVTSINIKGEITDDIELKSVVLKLDGTQIASFTEFKDYRRYLMDYTFDKVTNGDHVLEIIAVDLSGKSTTQAVNFSKKEPYKAMYDGEVFYMPFDGTYTELLSITQATKVGNPTFADTGKKGQAYMGATDSYITFPATTLKTEQFSASFWIKLNADPTRAGILVLSPDGVEDRKVGFRLFREGNNPTEQTLKLNIGKGTGEEWIDIAKVAMATADWMHIAFTVSTSEINVYVNNELKKTVTPAQISWNDKCTVLSIGSGMPAFTYWNHKSDLSLIDELRIFNKALTSAQVAAIYNDSK